MANPNSMYTPGGTVQAGKGIYLTRQADKQLLQLCRAGTFAYVLTARQMGKSSLMIHTARQLATEGILPIIVDLTDVGVQDVTAESWYRGVLLEIETKLEQQDRFLDTDVYEWWQNNNHLTSTQRFTRFFRYVLLQEIESQIVVFIDEIDTTLSLNFTDDFFSGIRSFHTARAQQSIYKRLSFVLIGVAAPGDLIVDVRRTPFNIGQRVDLTDFTLKEASPLKDGLNWPAKQAILQRIVQWTGGHPYLTQRLCIELIREDQSKWLKKLTQQERNKWVKSVVDTLVHHTFLGEKSKQDNHLQFVRNMLVSPKRSPDVLGGLETYRQIYNGQLPVWDEEQSLIKAHLKLSGLVKPAKNRLMIRNAIYHRVFDRRWIQEHWPQSWWQKVKPALPLVAASFAMVVITTGLAIHALQQTQKAKDESNIALARQLVLQSNAIRQSTNPLPVSLLLAIEANQRLFVTDSQNKVGRGEADQALRSSYELTTDELIQFTKHIEDVVSVSFSPDSRYVATASHDYTARVWSSKKGEELAKLKHDDVVNDVSFHPDGRTVATASNDNTVRVWNIQNGTELLRLKHVGDFYEGIFAVSFSPNGRYLATASLETTKVWDSQSGVELVTLDVGVSHKGQVSLSFSPDSRYLATSGQAVWVWDSQSGAKLSHFNDKDLFKYYANQSLEPAGLGRDGSFATASKVVSFSSDGRYLATMSNESTIRIWDLQDRLVLKINPDTTFNSNTMSFIPNSNYLAVTSFNKVQVWDIQSRLELLRIKNDREIVNGLSFSSNGKNLAFFSDTNVQVWDIESGRLLSSVHHDDTVKALKFSPDSQILATVSKDNTARLWNNQHEIVHIVLHHDSGVNAVNFSPDGRHVITASRDNTARMWDGRSGVELKQFTHDDDVNSVSFSPDGRIIATASSDNTARIWDSKSGVEIARLKHDEYEDKISFGLDDFPVLNPDGHVNAVSFSPDGRIVATASDDHTARLWDSKSGTELAQLKHDVPINHNGEVKTVKFSPDGSSVITASSDNTAIIWDGQSGAKLRVLSHDPNIPGRGFFHYVREVDVSPDNRAVVTASWDGTARVWNRRSGVELVRLYHDDDVNSVSFSPDGRTIATASSDNTARLWNSWSGAELARLDHNDNVILVRFSPDGRMVVTASNDNTARVWDSQSGAELTRVNHDDIVMAVAFSPDGRYVATASLDGTSQIHSVFTNSIIQLACQRLSRNLTVNEWTRYIGESESYRRTCNNLPYPEDYGLNNFFR